MDYIPYKVKEKETDFGLGKLCYCRRCRSFSYSLDGDDHNELSKCILCNKKAGSPVGLHQEYAMLRVLTRLQYGGAIVRCDCGEVVYVKNLSGVSGATTKHCGCAKGFDFKGFKSESETYRDLYYDETIAIGLILDALDENLHLPANVKRISVNLTKDSSDYLVLKVEMLSEYTEVKSSTLLMGDLMANAGVSSKPLEYIKREMSSGAVVTQKDTIKDESVPFEGSTVVGRVSNADNSVDTESYLGNLNEDDFVEDILAIPEKHTSCVSCVTMLSLSLDNITSVAESLGLRPSIGLEFQLKSVVEKLYTDILVREFTQDSFNDVRKFLAEDKLSNDLLDIVSSLYNQGIVTSTLLIRDKTTYELVSIVAIKQKVPSVSVYISNSSMRDVLGLLFKH